MSKKRKPIISGAVSVEIFRQFEELKGECGCKTSSLLREMVVLYRMAARKRMFESGAKITVEVDGERVGKPFQLMGLGGWTVPDE